MNSSYLCDIGALKQLDGVQFDIFKSVLKSVVAFAVERVV